MKVGIANEALRIRQLRATLEKTPAIFKSWKGSEWKYTNLAALVLMSTTLLWAPRNTMRWAIDSAFNWLSGSSLLDIAWKVRVMTQLDLSCRAIIYTGLLEYLENATGRRRLVISAIGCL